MQSIEYKLLSEADAKQNNLFKNLCGCGETTTTTTTNTECCTITGITNVLDYGATGDGITDDSDAVFNAILDCSGILFFPPGTYKITRTLSFSNLHNITLQGYGKSSIIQDNIPYPDPINTLVHLFIFDKTCSDIDINELSFNGELSNEDSRKYCFGIAGPRFVLQKCSFKKFNACVTIREADETKNSEEFIGHECKVLNSLFDGTLGAAAGYGYGILCVGKRTIVSGNTFTNVGRHDVYIAGAAYPNGGAQYCTVTNNTSYKCGFAPIALNSYVGQKDGCSFNVVDGNTMVDFGVVSPTYARGIAVSNNSCDNVISNNTIRLSLGGGIILEGGARFIDGEPVLGERPNRNSITGNNIRDCASYHINCINGSDNIFSGNVLSSIDVTTPTSRGIQIGKAGDTIPPVSGNIISDNVYIGLDNAPFVSPVANNDDDPPFAYISNSDRIVEYISPPPGVGGTIKENTGTVFVTAAEFDPVNNTGTSGTGWSLYLPRLSKGKTITVIRTDSTSKKIAIMTNPDTIKIDGEIPQYDTSAAKFFPPNEVNRRVVLVCDGIGWYSL